MTRLRAAIAGTGVLAAAYAVLLVAGALDARSIATAGEAAKADDAAFEEAVRNWVFVTDDNASVGDGCDGITSFSIRELAVHRRGTRMISPGPMALLPDLSMVVALRTNGLEVDLPERSRQPEMWKDLYVARLDATTYEQVEETYLDTEPPTLRPGPGGITTIPGSRDLLVATMSYDDGKNCPQDGPRPDYGLTRFSMDDANWDEHTLTSSFGTFVTGGMVAGISVTRDGRTAHVLTVPYSQDKTAPPQLISIDIDSMTETADRVDLEPIGELPVACDKWQWSIGLAHLAVSMDERYAFANTWRDGRLMVVDLEERSAVSVETSGLTKTGGVAFNRGPDNVGLIAVHGLGRVGVYEWRPPATLELVGITSAIVPPVVIYEPWKGNFGISSGPVASVAWSGGGDHIVAAGSHTGPREFIVWRVDNDGLDLTEVAAFEGCLHDDNYQNGIVTGNGLLSTYTPTASTTPSPTLTPTPTLTASTTPSPTATSTTVPKPLWLPVALRESCGDARGIDVVLVIDASTSMLETIDGKTKLAFAQGAVSAFIDQLLFEQRDQAAIVSFNAGVHTNAQLTDDRAALQTGLASIRTAQQTRIHLGIEAGRHELQGERARPGNTAAMIVLTDGRANPDPVRLAVEQADRAKVEGVRMFTIGLGNDLDAEALRAMASEGGYYHAVSAAELEAIYLEIADLDPCPGDWFWGGG